VPVMSDVRRRALAPAAALLLPAYLAACFQYVPAALPPLPKPSTQVRVTLAEPMNISMGEFTLHDVTRIEGLVAAANGDTLGLVAKWLYPRVGRKYDALYGSYDVPLAEVQQLEAWRFAPKRTAVFLGVTAVATVVILHTVWRVVSGGRLGEVEPPPASVVAPR